jgi:hypothetical protein
LLLVIWLSVAARAATGLWVSGETLRARLLAVTDPAGRDKEIHAGRQVSLAKHWDISGAGAHLHLTRASRLPERTPSSRCWHSPRY